MAFCQVGQQLSGSLHRAAFFLAFLLPRSILFEWVSRENSSSALGADQGRQHRSELRRVLAPRALAPEALAHPEVLPPGVGAPQRLGVAPADDGALG